jgi:hypothetical protein
MVGMRRCRARDSTRGENLIADGIRHDIDGGRPDPVIAALHETVDLE